MIIELKLKHERCTEKALNKFFTCQPVRRSYYTHRIMSWLKRENDNKLKNITILIIIWFMKKKMSIYGESVLYGETKNEFSPAGFEPATSRLQLFLQSRALPAELRRELEICFSSFLL